MSSSWVHGGHYVCHRARRSQGQLTAACVSASFTSARPPAAAIFRPIAHLARLGTARSDWSISISDRLDSAIDCERSSVQGDLRALRCQQQPRTGATFDSLRAAIRRPVRSLSMSTLRYHGGRYSLPQGQTLGLLLLGSGRSVRHSCFHARLARLGTARSDLVKQRT